MSGPEPDLCHRLYKEHFSKRVASYPVFETHRERDRLTKSKEEQKMEKRLLHRESGAGFRYFDGVKKQGHVFQSEGSQTRKPSEQEEMIARRRLARAGRAPGLRSAALVRTLPLGSRYEGAAHRSSTCASA